MRPLPESIRWWDATPCFFPPDARCIAEYNFRCARISPIRCGEFSAEVCSSPIRAPASAATLREELATRTCSHWRPISITRPRSLAPHPGPQEPVFPRLGSGPASRHPARAGRAGGYASAADPFSAFQRRRAGRDFPYRCDRRRGIRRTNQTDRSPRPARPATGAA